MGLCIYLQDGVDPCMIYILFLLVPNWNDWTNTGFIIFGSAFTFVDVDEKIFVWWQIHPIGYTMLSFWSSHKLWFQSFWVTLPSMAF